MKELKELEIREGRSPRVAIIGSSHSAYSAAQMLIYGPATFKHNCPSFGKECPPVPGAELKKVKNCDNCKHRSHCNCLGHFKYEEWDFDFKNDLPTFTEDSIKLC